MTKKTMRACAAALACVALQAAGVAVAQSVGWAVNVTAPGARPATLGDGEYVTRMMALDGSGNVVVAGTYSDGTSKNWVVTKLSAAGGAVAWQKTFNGAANRDDEAMAVALDASGNAIVVGSMLDAAGNSDVRVIKYAAADGAVQWQATFDGGTSDYPYAVLVDASGNVLVGAESRNAQNNNDVKILKYNGANGALAWAQTLDSGQDDFLSDIALDVYGNVLGAGVKMNANGTSDIVAFKVGSNGAVAWNKTYDLGNNEEAFAVATDPSANLLVTGYVIAAGKEAKTIKFNGVNGAVLWEATAGGAGDQVGEAIAVDASGNVVVAVQSGSDVRTVKYNGGSGAVMWDKTAGAGNANVYQLTLDPAGNAIVVGSSATAGYDWLALNYAAADGRLRWTYKYNGGTGGADVNFGVVAGPAGVFLGGTTMEAAGIAMRIVKLSSSAGGGNKRRYDFDGNGASDILWQHPDGRVMLSLVTNGTPGTAQTLLNAGTGWTVKFVGDFDGDGKSDIVFQHTDGSAAVWLMNGATQVGGGRILAAGTGWTAVAVGDVDGDGRDDILWQHTDGSAALWIMNGATQAGGGKILAAGTGWAGKAMGDLDGDGKADILFQHTDGRTAAWTMNGVSQVGGTVLLAGGLGWNPVRIVDLDGDGKGDVVWQHTDGRTAAWTMNGLAQKGGAVLVAAGTGWTVKSEGDYNADGKVDLAWQHTDGRVGLWTMNGLAQSGAVGVTVPVAGLLVK